MKAGHGEYVAEPASTPGTSHFLPTQLMPGAVLARLGNIIQGISHEGQRLTLRSGLNGPPLERGLSGEAEAGCHQHWWLAAWPQPYLPSSSCLLWACRGQPGLVQSTHKAGMGTLGPTCLDLLGLLCCDPH